MKCVKCMYFMMLVAINICAVFHAVPAASPQIIQSMIVNSSSVLISWQPPPLNDRNGIISIYVVNVSLEVNDTMPKQYITSSLNVTLVGLNPFSTYVVAVAAETSVGRGPFSVFTIYTPEDGKASSVMIFVTAC